MADFERFKNYKTLSFIIDKMFMMEALDIKKISVSQVKAFGVLIGGVIFLALFSTMHDTYPFAFVLTTMISVVFVVKAIIKIISNFIEFYELKNPKKHLVSFGYTSPNHFYKQLINQKDFSNEAIVMLVNILKESSINNERPTDIKTWLDNTTLPHPENIDLDKIQQYQKNVEKELINESSIKKIENSIDKNNSEEFYYFNKLKEEYLSSLNYKSKNNSSIDKTIKTPPKHYKFRIVENAE